MFTANPNPIPQIASGTLCRLKKYFTVYIYLEDGVQLTKYSFENFFRQFATLKHIFSSFQ